MSVHHEYTPADIATLDQAAIEDHLDNEYADETVDLAGYFVASSDDGERGAVIRFLAHESVSTPGRFQWFIDVLCHEIHHDVLYDIVGSDACVDLDNIAGRGTYLVNGDHEL